MKPPQSLFVEPHPSQTLIATCQFFSPLYVHLKARIDVQIEPSVEDAFKLVKSSAAIICPNHAHEDDALTVFELSQKVHTEFLFLTTREVFRLHPTLRSLWLQSLGCYSIMRATPDMKSFHASLELLTSGPNKLLLFPEGEVSQNNESLQPFEPGASYLALHAADQLAQQKAKRSLYLVPLAILYRVKGDNEEFIAETLRDQEDQLGIEPNGRSSYRIKMCYDRMLSVQETLHKLPNPVGKSIEERIRTLSMHRLKEIACVYNVDLTPHHSVIDKLHALRTFLTKRRCCDQKEPSPEVRRDYHTIIRLTALQSITEASFNSPMTQEHAVELLHILDVQIGCNRPPLPRIAHISAATPIDVAHFCAEFEGNRSAAIEMLHNRMHCEIQNSLKQLELRYTTAAIVH